MTDTPRKDLTALFPAPPVEDLPPGLEFMRRSLARGLEVSGLPDGIDAAALATNLYAAFGEVNDYARPDTNACKRDARAVDIAFDQHVHYPTLMRVFAEVLDDEFSRRNIRLTDENMPRVRPLDVIENPSNPPPRGDKYSGPRFLGH